MEKRRLSLLQAVSLNMAMMVGIGPFITIPDLTKALAGPLVLLAWLLGAFVAICDGLVWSELAAAYPGSGGTYHYFDAVYGNKRSGRLLKFLFVWQFLFSGPLELASGAIGFGLYAGFLWPGLKGNAANILLPGGLTWPISRAQVVAMGVMTAVVALAYRRIEVAGRLMVVLWAGMVATLAALIVSGLTRFDATMAFSLPKDAGLSGLGVALGMAMYCYLGYYQVCYLGDEVERPEITIPRAILISTAAVAAVYLLLNLAILGVLPRAEVVGSSHVASDLMSRRFGPWAATVTTALILWTGAAGTFSGVLGYARIPYAAARSGHFFRGLAATHPTGGFPHRSLLLVGLLSVLACLADLPTVIQALLTSRILIQFVGQIVTVFALHRRPGSAEGMPFRMWFYPVPALVALGGWLYVFGTSGRWIIAYGLGSLAAGVAAFAIWERAGRHKEPFT